MTPLGNPTISNSYPVPFMTSLIHLATWAETVGWSETSGCWNVNQELRDICFAKNGFIDDIKIQTLRSHSRCLGCLGGGIRSIRNFCSTVLELCRLSISIVRCEEWGVNKKSAATME